jgi:integrase
MQLKDAPEADEKMVWLLSDEIETLLEHADGVEQKIGFALAARCGLRTKELLEVDVTDVVDGPSGRMLRVWDGKGSKYRETPMPESLWNRIEAYHDVRDAGDGDPLVQCSARTYRRWVSRAAERALATTGDEGWQFLSPHDLRRSWGQSLVESDCEPGVIMEWGGWEDWETFRESYLGHYSAAKQRQEREKVAWL